MQHDRDVMRHCAREYLRHVRRMRARLDMIEAEVAQIQARMTLLGVDYSKGRGTGAAGERMSDGIAALFDVRERWSQLYAETSEDLARARDICSPDRPDRHALWLHDVEGRTWSASARILHVSERTVRNMAERGCAEVYALMPERWRREPIPNAMPR